MPPETVFLTILFADISGSTHLYETLGDVTARQMVARCLSLLAAVIRQHGGTVIKTIGDEVMSTFPSADAGVQAACALHEALAKADFATTEQNALTIRVGLHLGPTIVESNDVFGDAVNVAARMVALAKSAQIITTQQTIAALTPELVAKTRHLDRAPVKGKQEEIDIYEVIWQTEGLTHMEADHSTPVAPQVGLCLRFHGKEIELSRHRPVVTIGRSPKNDFVVEDDFASRSHARIEYHRGGFVLLDQSTNGTFVVMKDSEPVHLRRDSLPLRGTGTISIGRAFGTELSPELIHFTLQILAEKLR
ncbi:MAG TPA: adenylate/guanylate cyclase domain-containing protein [Candidatus Binatia bacterium]|jgi:class 3 adenylate cyclase|nr:adenylate/guanylate cyclase domain-containing protein [Candidatus Binatia bacterium]